MLVAGTVAGALCLSVGWMVITHGFGLTRSLRQERQVSDHAQVTDCLANVDKVIDLPSLEEIVFDVPRLEVVGDRSSVDHVIDLRDVKPRHVPAVVPPRPAPAAVDPWSDPLIDEPPSIWHPPSSRAARSVTASA